MRILSQLAFNGTCRQAFAYYESVLKGKVVVMNAHGDSRDIPLPPGSRASAPEHIRFAELHVGEWALLGNDVPAEDYEPMRGFNVALHADSVEEAQRIFNALAQGGEIRAPLTQMPWAARFGQLVNRSGTPWLILALPGWGWGNIGLAQRLDRFGAPWLVFTLPDRGSGRHSSAQETAARTREVARMSRNTESRRAVARTPAAGTLPLSQAQSPWAGGAG